MKLSRTRHSRGFAGIFAAGALYGLVLSSCTQVASGPQGQDGPAAADLHKLAAETLAESSFRMEFREVGSGAGGVLVVTDYYQAPDRVRTVIHSGGVTTQLIIGPTEFASIPGKPGYFNSFPAPANAVELQTLFLLRMLTTATDVVQSGDTFTFSVAQSDYPYPLTGGRGEARVADGRVVYVKIQGVYVGRAITATGSFSRFGSAPPVTPPPADHVTPCGPEGNPSPGTFVCMSTGTP